MAAPHPAPAPSPARARTAPPAAGRGRGRRPSRRTSSRAFISLYRRQVAHCSSSRSCGRALQRVVHQLGRVEELLAPVDHLPLALEPDVAHQRHERVEDLRHPAAERGGRDVHDPRALQRLGQLADLLDQLAAADVRVVGERLVPTATGWSTRAESSCAQRPRGVSSGRSPSLTRRLRRSPSAQDAEGHGLRRAR